MICKTCNNPMQQVHGQKHFHCDSCNTFEFKTDIRHTQIPIWPQGTMTDFQCPKCEQPLEVGLIHSEIQVCFCNNCRGFVTSTDSLGTLINDLRSSYDGPDDQPVPIDPNELDVQESCPACLQKMDAHPYYGPGNVVLDTCDPCQLAWLDHGEIDTIVRAPGPRPNQRPTGNFESQLLKARFAAQAIEHGFGIL